MDLSEPMDNHNNNGTHEERLSQRKTFMKTSLKEKSIFWESTSVRGHCCHQLTIQEVWSPSN